MPVNLALRKRRDVPRTLPLSAAQRLPFELLVPIVQWSAPGIPFYVENQKKLCATCLVCRSWVAAVRYVLYSSVWLYSSTITTRLCRTLARRPDLRALVRAVYFVHHVCDYISARLRWQLFKPIYASLQRCTSLRSLSLWAADNDAAVTSLGDIKLFLPVAELPLLRALVLKFAPARIRRGITRHLRRDDPTFSIRGVLPQLETLSLEAFDLRALRPCALPRLRTLSVHTGRLTPEALHTLVSACGPGLVQLEVGSYLFPEPDRCIFDATASQTVRVLCILGCPQMSQTLALPSWPALSEVHMPWLYIWHLRVLPHTVVRLTVLCEYAPHHPGRIWRLAEGVWRAMRAWRGLTHLRILDDHCMYWELPTWRVASFLLSEISAAMGVALAVDVRVLDLRWQLKQLRLAQRAEQE